MVPLNFGALFLFASFLLFPVLSLLVQLLILCYILHYIALLFYFWITLFKTIIFFQNLFILLFLSWVLSFAFSLLDIVIKLLFVNGYIMEPLYIPKRNYKFKSTNNRTSRIWSMKGTYRHALCIIFIKLSKFYQT